MAEPQGMPQPPAGMQRPGIPGAGNILDPEVRGEIREKLQPAVHEAGQKARGAGEAQEASTPEKTAKPPESISAQQSLQGHRAGPYPHGDVDLSFISANVPSEPVRPRRSRTGRRFYFLPESKPAAASAPQAKDGGPNPA